VSVAELYERLRELAGFDARAEHAPAREGDVPHSLASIERARALLGFEPLTPLAEGLRRTLEWYRGRAGDAG